MLKSKLSRRHFIGVAGGAVLFSGAGASASSETSKPPLFEVTYPATVPSARRVLVAYASGNGSTIGVAEVIGKELASQGDVTVEVRHVSRVTDLASYQALVLGSPIHSGVWLPEATAFLTANRQRLTGIPTAFFLVCMTKANPTEKNLAYVESYFKPIRATLHPVSEGSFAGALWFKDYSFFVRTAFRVWFAIADLTEGDHRDWKAIQSWARSLRPLLG